MTIFLIIMVTITVLFIMAAMRVVKESDVIHAKLREFVIRAENCDTIKGLRSLKREVLIFSRERCWHYNHVAHAERVLAYINGRLCGCDLKLYEY